MLMFAFYRVLTAAKGKKGEGQGWVQNWLGHKENLAKGAAGWLVMGHRSEGKESPRWGPAER